MTDTIYAIGDIHGQHEMLLNALTRIEADGGAQSPVVILGDLVDRGPASRAVIDTLIAGQERGRNWTVLMGNHDRLFLDFLETGTSENPLIRSGKGWLDDRLGGAQTLASYGLDPTESLPRLQAAAQRAVPQAHRDFLAACPLYLERGPHLFVHAGIQPRLPLDWQTEDDLLWIRDPFLTWSEPFDWLVIHGHTAQEVPRHYGNRVNLDSGAGWGRPLTAAAIEGRQVWVLTDDGRVPLEP
ncbi:metallophosphoesterase family protein [Marimonas lutisalis]|uniref:metallophosphoesterase family protein n=1 Tax=Marimonas lutisalis TaxID=2545756 RepID=UPI0010F64147|nr:metallophosphoesterase family protein [Marimonas lutisalis]